MSEEQRKASRRLSRGGFLLVLLAVFGLFLLIVRRFLLPAFLAALTVGLFRPMHRFLADHIPKPKWAAAGISTLAIVLVFLIPLSGLVYLAFDSLVEIAPAAADSLRSLQGGFSAISERLRGIPLIGQGVELILGGEGLTRSLETLVTTAAEQATDALGETPELVLLVFIYVYSLYFFFRDDERIAQAVVGVFPLRAPLKKRLVEQIGSVTRAILRGTIIVGAIQGTIIGLTMYVLGLPGAVLWGGLVMVLAVIPGFGPLLVWLPGAVALLSSGRALAAVVLVAVGVGPTAVVDNILRPKLIGDDARIHQILILFGVIGGITVFGLFGFLIGPIVMAIFVQLLSVYREEFQPDVDRPPAEDN
jgi:predicted PurR-regulated permease PerM